MKKKFRHPIVMGPGVVALIQIFQKTGEIDDLWSLGFGDRAHRESLKPEKQAKQFISQLKDHWTPGFLVALHKEIERELIHHWRDFAPERLKDEPYKSWLKKPRRP
jgi:hypothetical protein